MTGRSWAAMAAGTVQDEARQDEGHAGDSDHVRQVLRGEGRGMGSRMGCVIGGLEVDHHVQDATERHDEEAEEHQRRQMPERAESLYHQHVLEIHRRPEDVNSIARNRM